MDRSFERAWTLRAAALGLWAFRPVLGALQFTLDARIEFGALALLATASGVELVRSTAPARLKWVDLTATSVFVVYFVGWLVWLTDMTATGPSWATDPNVVRAATLLSIAVLAYLARDLRRARALVLISVIAWLLDLPALHQPLFLMAPRFATLLALIGVVSALLAIQLMVAARRTASE